MRTSNEAAKWQRIWGGGVVMQVRAYEVNNATTESGPFAVLEIIWWMLFYLLVVALYKYRDVNFMLFPANM